jgi:hypothetical protein
VVRLYISSRIFQDETGWGSGGGQCWNATRRFSRSHLSLLNASSQQRIQHSQALRFLARGKKRRDKKPCPGDARATQ